MIVPEAFDMLEVFGLEPEEFDASDGYFRFVKKNDDDRMEIDVSFSAVLETFQFVLRYRGTDIVTFSSEKTNMVEIFNEKTGAGVRAIFELDGALSEAIVTFEPALNCKWWVLRA